MGFWDFPFKQKAFRFERLVDGDGTRRKKKPSWLNPVSHGCYIIDRLSYIDSSPNADSVTVQRKQQSEQALEVRLFAVSDAGTGKEIVKYIQNHLFDKLHDEHGVLRKCKEVMRRAYVEEDRSSGSAASVTVVNGEKLAMASMGGHRVVVCRNGEAYQIRSKSSTRNWSDFIFPVCNQVETDDESDPRNSELALVTEKINSDIEFIIIGSSGIWEVMKNQEAINLIRHMEDPQEAAKCLAKEALNRISKSEISCSRVFNRQFDRYIKFKTKPFSLYYKET